MGNNELVIAIDGPSGSGKSSVGREVARRLGLGYLDTGAMYRAVTWAVLEKGTDFCDSAAIAALAREIEIIMSTDPDREYVALTHTGNDGTHAVTEAIRMPEVSGKVSAVAACAEVRRHLVRLQQELIATLKRRVVVDGRDITTVVAPDADFRLILTARPEVRIRRRWMQLDEAGIAKVSGEQLQEQVVGRDIKDSEVNDFMDAADGVVVLDSSDLNFDGTVTAVMRLVLRKAGMSK